MIRKRKSIFKGLFGDILFAVFVATLVGALFMKAYAIPTPSMEGTLMVGDHMFVSKFHYGSRLPETPLQIPLTHQKIWGTDIPAYLDWVKLPYFRLPGLTEVKTNDIVVFNYPAEHEEYPVDLRTYYVKRCVGLPGDTLSIIDQQIYLNGSVLHSPGVMQSSYFIETNTTIRDRIFYKHHISDVYKIAGGYVVHASSADIEDLQKLEFVQSVQRIDYQKGADTGSMYADMNGEWNQDNYGPLYIPKKGDQIILDETNTERYKDVILHFERNENMVYRDGKLFQDGNALESYIFKQDYYFMMGDNRHNSEDSRFWGFVPEDHIVGKPLFIYWSVDDNPDKNYFQNIRWERFLRGVADA